jgi:hypothetical protein
VHTTPRRSIIERVAAIPVTDADVVPQSTRAVVMSCVSAIVAGLIIWSVYAGGRSRGMDHALAYGLEIDATPISVALSETVYGLDLGYIGLASVYNAMVKTFTDRANEGYDHAAMQRDARDGQVINQAISSAASLGPQRVGYISDRTLITMLYQDLGSVDYIKLSFRLFGRRIEAIYNTFFVVVGVSALLYILTFPNSLTAQLVLLATLFAFLLELHTAIFTPSMPTFATIRHGSTLCLIPAWYFAGLILQRRRMSWVSLGLAIGQLAVLMLALQIRSTVMWALAFLGVLAIVSGTYEWLTAADTVRTWPRWLRHVAAWPVVLVIASVAIQGQYMKLKLHPVYFTDDIMPGHPLWHSAYIGLQYSPELYGFPVREGTLGGDDLVNDGALEYLRAVHFIGNKSAKTTREALEAGGYYSVWNGGNQKWALHDQIVRRMVVRTALRHPLTMLHLYLLKKPVAIAEVFEQLLVQSERVLITLLLAGGLGVALFWIVFGNPRELTNAVRLVPVGAAAIIASLLPCVWAYPVSWTITDGLLLTFTVVVLVIGISVAAVYTGARQAASRRGVA